MFILTLEIIFGYLPAKLLNILSIEKYFIYSETKISVISTKTTLQNQFPSKTLYNLFMYRINEGKRGRKKENRFKERKKKHG